MLLLLGKGRTARRRQTRLGVVQKAFGRQKEKTQAVDAETTVFAPGDVFESGLNGCSIVAFCGLGLAQVIIHPISPGNLFKNLVAKMVTG